MLVHYLESFLNLPSTHHVSPRFKLGRIFATPAAVDVMNAAHVSIVDLLIRHVRGDWGDLPESDRQQNESAVNAGLRLLSSYVLPNGQTVRLITEWDRSASTNCSRGTRRPRCRLLLASSPSDSTSNRNVND